MTRIDDPLIPLLIQETVITPAEAESLRIWHETQAQSGETMTDFLTRQGVLTKVARRVLDLRLKGYVATVELASVWPRAALAEARKKFENVPAADAPRTTHSVVPIYSTVDARDLNGPPSDMMPKIDRPSIGDRVGRCLLTDLIAEGGGGSVYRALHQGLNIPVAVKLLNPERASSDVRERLKAEARSLAKLDHPNVVRVLDHDDSEPPHLVLEFIDGPNVADLIRQAGAIRFDRALAIIRQAAEGLFAAEQIGILHRDVKPANILLTRRGVAKVADFGLAVAASSLAEPPMGVAGTLPFMSREQLDPVPQLDARADIYSLGVTFYQAVTGRLPFRARTMQALVEEIRSAQPDPPHFLVAGLTPDVSHVILRMMAARAEDRYSGYAELLVDLTELAARLGDPTP